MIVQACWHRNVKKTQRNQHVPSESQENLGKIKDLPTESQNKPKENKRKSLFLIK